MSSNFSFLQELLTTVADTSRSFLPGRMFAETDGQRGLQALVDALMSGKGEASGMAIAHQLLRHYRELDDDMRRVFFQYLAQVLQPDPAVVQAAAEAYRNDPVDAHLKALQRAVESPCQEFFRRLNMAPGATAEIVAMRRELLAHMRDEPSLQAIDRDLFHLLQSWFNRGFLVLRRIDWQTPAAILEKIIAYEAVHEIDGWEDLRRRLEPADRRCFGFFHPSLVDEPLIFVEVALTDSVAGNIASLIDPPRDTVSMTMSVKPTTAVFYSISNCQEGLRGVSFGNFLIKQVVDELSREFPSLTTFVTLSPVPSFARWLNEQRQDDSEAGILNSTERELLKYLDEPAWWADDTAVDLLREPLIGLAAHYFLDVKGRGGKPLDPVARFHLGNGARLERINWMSDLSERGLAQSFGIMVNYLYDTREIEANHEAFANEGTVAASRVVRGYQRSRVRGSSEKSTLPTLRLSGNGS